MNDPRHPAHPAQPPHPAQPAHPPHPQNVAPHAPRPGVGMQAPNAPRVPVAPRPAGAPGQPATLPRPAGGATINPAAHAPRPQDEEAIALVEDDDDDLAKPVSAPSKIKFGADIGIKKHDWKRQLKSGGSGACRVRTFHGKLSDQGLEYVDEAINSWLDDHPEIDVKFVTTNVGMFDGKFKDLALIVNVWY